MAHYDGVYESSASVFCSETGSQDCRHCMSLPKDYNCGWCSSLNVCTAQTQCKAKEWLSSEKSCPNNTVLSLFICLAVLAIIVVLMVLAYFVVVLCKTWTGKSSSVSSGSSISAVQKRLFGRKKSKETLPVVLLSYRSNTRSHNYLQDQFVEQVNSTNHHDEALYAVIDKRVSTPSSSFQGTMIFNVHRDRYGRLQRHRPVSQINRLSCDFVWANTNSNEQDGGSDDGSMAASPVPLPMPPLFGPNTASTAIVEDALSCAQRGHEVNTILSDTLAPINCQTSLLQMAANQFYLVVQINTDSQANSSTTSRNHNNNCEQQQLSIGHVYENVPQYL